MPANSFCMQRIGKQQVWSTSLKAVANNSIGKNHRVDSLTTQLFLTASIELVLLTVTLSLWYSHITFPFVCVSHPHTKENGGPNDFNKMLSL